MAGKSEILQENIFFNIRNGILKPGDAIPSRNQLRRKYGLSGDTVDRAVRELIKRGYLTARQGEKTRVAVQFPQGGELQRIFVLYHNKSYRDTALETLILDSPDYRLPVITFPEAEGDLRFANFLEPGSAVICYYPGYDMLHTLNALKTANIPLLLLNRDYEGFNFAATDPKSSLREGLAWLLIEGGRDLAIVTGAAGHLYPYRSQRIIAAYESAIELGANLSSGNIYSYPSGNLPADISEIASRLFLKPDSPRSIMLLDTSIAMPLVSCGLTLGKMPGRDYFLLIFDYVDELKNYPGVGMMRQQLPLLYNEARRWLVNGYAQRNERFQSYLKTELRICRT